MKNEREISYKKLKNGWIELLSSIDWDIFITFTFKDNPHSFESGYDYLSEYFKLLKEKYTKIQFGGISFGLIDRHNFNKTIHFHSLIACNHNYPENFSTFSFREIKQLEQIWDHGRIGIQVIDNQEGIIKYISGKNIRFDNVDEYQIFPHRKNLLLELQKRKA